jgi:hypothetical protein
MMLGFVLLATLIQAPAASSPPPKADSRLARAHRFERGGWIYVHLEGEPAHVGYQHGYLLAREIEDLLGVLRPLLEHSTKRDWTFYRNAAEAILWRGVESEYQAEIDGIVEGLAARGVKADRWDIVALNALEELPYYYLPWLEKESGHPPTTHSPGNCSAFVATGSYTKDHGIVMGHNNWTNYVTGARWNVIFDLVPSKGHRILMDGLPGVITSDDDFGVNARGIMVTETTITGFTLFDPAGTPEFSRSRKALQYSETIDDYVRMMLEKNNGGYANDWLIGDSKTGEIALFELGLKEHSLRRTKDGYFVGSNFPVDPALTREETNFDVSNTSNSPNGRRARWEELMAQHKGSIDVEVAKLFETDGYDAVLKRPGPNERTLCGCVERSPRGTPEWDWGPYFPGGTVQTKVIDSAMAGRLEFWAAVGHSCGGNFSAGEFLKAHPEYGWMKGLLKDMPAGPWTRFGPGMK